ncbi:transcriptional regulator with XRE-family HTH domain [Bradyrhizobium sp. AZCC 1678]|uniref:helix-turn-helix domain-containing protein n=1 Tax=Bradyrhizobium sp. AZCC 1678 TaxID=3117030 RepID=UPI002FF1165F
MGVNESKAIDIVVGRRIRNLRLRQKVSQNDVAGHLKLTFQQIQKYEQGISRISASQLFELAKLFKVSIDTFFTDFPADGRQKKSARSLDQLTDRHLLRLVEAFESLKDRRLKSAVVELAEEMARCQAK